ncbi:DUF309 domain-containing protein [Paenibacillus lycopersici]|uniref:DUF309 domain-containing protein n=1 Tax=Paenibacillus lycopersici TaxID=2704462 RepID=A0A6C0G8B2_9BACL|nr:DUF309 domain-containing protein [Paenibacillus lycopersici]
MVLFNTDRDYFECHEVMEELWLEEGRNLLYQGLLQAAVGLHHWRNENFSGAVKLFKQADSKLVQYPDEQMGIDLRRLRADVAGSLALLVGEEDRLLAPAFAPFRLVITDERLMMESEALAQMPLEQRLHPDA